MEYQKIANLVDDTSNQPSKFRTKNWVEINDESRGAYDANSQIKFKMIQSGGFLGKLLGPLLKTGLPLIKSVIKKRNLKVF